MPSTTSTGGHFTGKSLNPLPRYVRWKAGAVELQLQVVIRVTTSPTDDFRDIVKLAARDYRQSRSRTVGVPYESTLRAKPIFVGYCSECNIYDEPYRAVACPDGHGRMRKRMAYKCPGIEMKICDFYFFTKRALIEHEHGFV